MANEVVDLSNRRKLETLKERMKKVLSDKPDCKIIGGSLELIDSKGTAHIIHFDLNKITKKL